ncbi:MAG: phosphotransferase [Anaerolineales bacterium]
MSEIAVLRQALRRLPALKGDWTFEHLGQNAYCLQQGGRRFFAKWIADDDERGRNELEIYRTVLRRADLPTPALLHVLPAGPGRLALWEWLDGEDLRQEGRQLLPQAFRLLGHFHAAQRHTGPLSSPVTAQVYASVADLLQGEAATLAALLPPSFRQPCADFLMRLTCGYPTLIHGDMHPGNLRRVAEGLYFVDWGYARRSLNLFDLDYIRSLDLGDQITEWWHIRPEEAVHILPAYFEAAGLSACDCWAIHRGVMLWSALWAHFNLARAHDLAAQKTCRQRITRILEEK